MSTQWGVAKKAMPPGLLHHNDCKNQHSQHDSCAVTLRNKSKKKLHNTCSSPPSWLNTYKYEPEIYNINPMKPINGIKNNAKIGQVDT